MHRQYIKPHLLAASKIKNSREEIGFPRLVYPKRVQEMNANRAFLLTTIESYANKWGYCYAHTTTLKRETNRSVRSIQRDLQWLEDNHYIFRNTYATPCGKRRHIVPRRSFSRYWKVFLNRPKIPDSLKKEFLEFISKKPPHLKKKIAIHSRKVAQYEKSNLALAYTLSNERDKNNYINKKNGVFYSSKKNFRLKNKPNPLDPNPKKPIRWVPPDTSLTEASIKNALLIHNATPEQITRAVDYFHTSEWLLRKKRSPYGFLVQMFVKTPTPSVWEAGIKHNPLALARWRSLQSQNQLAQEQKEREKKAYASAKLAISANKPKAEEVLKPYISGVKPTLEKEGFSIAIHEKALSVKIRKESPYGLKYDFFPLTFAEEKFDEQLTLIENNIKNFISKRKE